MTLTGFHRKYESGGLGLTAGDFAQLSRPNLPDLVFVLLTTTTAALMCLAQIAFQFYLYPYVELFDLSHPPLTSVLLATWGKLLLCVLELLAGV
jgi:hypothetical protein